MEVYVAQLIWPASQNFPDVDTAYVWVAGRAWKPLFTVVGANAIAGELWIGHGSAAWRGPVAVWNGTEQRAAEVVFRRGGRQASSAAQQRLLCGRIVLIGAFFLSYGLGAEMLNFGALIAFMGVNAAALLRYFVRAEEKKVWNFIPPVVGFLICLALWAELEPAGDDCRKHLDDRGNCSSGVEDELVPGTPVV